ncbi:hypothetical protein Ahy_B01g051839 [Arachis hypogaea]|uniref:C3H1-type domain-containing protein n=1 Tax=Arachis hypogaea TaxID=3818 RepID=A0A445AMX6_ARAHY|nr:hypothetical protein Ahy_B01g051839 [Arachis hypogaea]
MESKINNKTCQEGLHHRISALLEFSASDDVTAFKEAIEKEGHNVGETGLWYGRRIGTKEVGYEERNPLMIAAMFGSKNVLSYILKTGKADVNKSCGSDSATALHCAVDGASPASAQIIKLLLESSANPNAVDARGNRCYDLVVSMPSVYNTRKKAVQSLLEGANNVYKKEATSIGISSSLNERGKVAAGTAEFPVSPRYKEFPVDHSLPDIKNGIYSTDEFRMYTFKVKPCSRAYSHDWTECPFAHPGENAKRRDPRKYQYSCVPCPEFRKGSCSKGDSCEYAHGIFECWLHPAQYRTRLCKDEMACTRRVCFFAHKPEELRPLYACSGSALPSPTSYSPGGANSLDICSSLSSPDGGGSGSSPVWQAPQAKLPKSRLNLALSARDVNLDIQSIGLESRRLMQKLMMEEMVSSALSPNSSTWRNSLPTSPSFASPVPSPTNIWGSASNYSPSHSKVIGSPAAYGLDLSGGGVSLRSPSEIPSPSKNSIGMESSSSTLFGWGSPDGKLDWSIRRDEFNKMNKSNSFAFRSTANLVATPELAEDAIDELDVSWVSSLVKDSSSNNYSTMLTHEQFNEEHDDVYARMTKTESVLVPLSMFVGFTTFQHATQPRFIELRTVTSRV